MQCAQLQPNILSPDDVGVEVLPVRCVDTCIRMNLYDNPQCVNGIDKRSVCVVVQLS